MEENLKYIVPVVALVVISAIGGSWRLWRWKTTAIHKAGKQSGSIVLKLDTLLGTQDDIVTKVDKLAVNVAEVTTWGRANSEGIDRLNDRIDRHLESFGHD